MGVADAGIQVDAEVDVPALNGVLTLCDQQ